jgi:parvulin-like peptidyl-prolyl isomerase
MKKNRIKYIVFIPGLFFVLVSGVFAQDKIAAIVNNDVITQKDLNDFVNFMRMDMGTSYSPEEVEQKIDSMKADLLDKLIDDRLILQEAKKSNLVMDESRVKAKISEIKRHYSSDREFQQTIAQQGLVQADLENKIRDQILMYSIMEIKVKGNIVINPTEITQYYENNIAEFNIPEKRLLDTLTTEDEAIANEISSALKEGSSFSDVAAKYNLEIGQMSINQGEELKKEVEEVVLKLNPQDFSSPVKIGSKFYIFKLNSIVPAKQLSLAEVQEKIRDALSNKRTQEKMSAWLNELKKKSYIKIVQD